MKASQDAKRSLIRRGLDAIFGYDFFVSYTRRDGGREYAEALARRLEAAGFQIFFDSDDYAMGDDWKVEGNWALRRTSQLVLVASPEALSASAVIREVEIYSKLKKRRIIPIDFGGTIRDRDESKPIFQHLKPEILFIEEDPKYLGSAPSDLIIQKLQDGFNLKRQDAKRSRIFSIAAVVLAVLAIAATVAAGLAIKARKETEKQLRISQATGLSNTSTALLSRSPRISSLAAIEAIDATRRADEPVLPVAYEALIGSVASAGGTPLIAHHGAINDMDLGSNGRWLATASADGTVLIWDLNAEPFESFELTNYPEAAMAVRFSADGRWIATGGGMGKAKLQRLAKDSAEGFRIEETFPLEGHSAMVTTLAFDPGSRHVATAGADGKLRIWQLPDDDDNGSLQAVRSHAPNDGHTATAMEFGPDGSLAAADDSGNCFLWSEPLTDSPPKVYRQDVRHVPSLDALRVGDKPFAFGPREGLRVFGRQLLTADDGPKSLGSSYEIVTEAKFSENGSILVYCGRNMLFGSRASNRVLNPPSATVPRGLRGHDGYIEDIAFAPFGNAGLLWWATAGADRTIRLWTLEPANERLVLRGHSQAVRHLRFNDHMLISGGDDGVVRLWDLRHILPMGSKQKHTSPSPTIYTERASVKHLHASDDGSRLVAGFAMGAALSYEMSEDRIDISTFKTHGSKMQKSALALNHGGSLLLSATGATVTLSRVEPATELAQFEHPDGTRVTAVAWDPASEWFVTGCDDKKARLWKVPTSERDQAVDSEPPKITEAMAEYAGHADRITAVDVSRRGEWFATGSVDGTSRIWPVDLTRSTGSDPLHVLEGHSGAVNDVAFSADDHWFVSVGEDQSVRVWDVSNPANPIARPPMRGHTGAVACVVFGSDSKNLATGSEDATIRLWDLDAEDPTLASVELRGHTRTVTGLVFTRSGNALISGSEDATIRTWELRLDVLIDEARRTAGEELSPSERKRLLTSP